MDNIYYEVRVQFSDPLVDNPKNASVHDFARCNISYAEIDVHPLAFPYSYILGVLEEDGEILCKTVGDNGPNTWLFYISFGDEEPCGSDIFHAISQILPKIAGKYYD